MKYKTVKVWATMETECYAHLNVPESWDDQRIYEHAKDMDGGDFVPAGDWAGDWTIQPGIDYQPYNPDHTKV